jgi:hypothetical protein
LAVWNRRRDYIFNSPFPAVEYVHVRDFANQFVFAGWVTTFSESGKLRELVLRDVQVFDFDGALLYEVPLMYVARKPEDIHVEFPSGGAATATDDGAGANE